MQQQALVHVKSGLEHGDQMTLLNRLARPISRDLEPARSPVERSAARETWGYLKELPALAQ